MWVNVNAEWFNLLVAIRVRVEAGIMFIEFPPLSGEHITISVEDPADQRAVLNLLSGGKP